MFWKWMGIIAIMSIVFAGIGIAWEMGNTLTPSEFADIDIDKHDFNPTPTGTEIIGAGSSGALYRVNVQVNSFEKVSANEYEETIKMLNPQVGVKDYIDCRAAGETAQYCDATLKASLIINAASSINSEKEAIKEEQTEAAKMALYANELQAGDITITQAEIEAAIAAQLE